MQVGTQTWLFTSQCLMIDAVQRVRLSNMTQYIKFTIFSSVHYHATPFLPLQEISKKPKNPTGQQCQDLSFFSPTLESQELH